MRWMLLVLLVLIAASADGQAPEAAVSGEPTLDELLGLTPETRSAESPLSDAPPPGGGAPGPPLDLSLDEPPTEVFDQAVADMKRAADRLGFEQDPGIDTQRLQQDVITKLERMIEQLQNQQSSSSSRQSGQQKEQAKQDVGSKPGEQQAAGGGNNPATTVGPPGQVNPHETGESALAERVDAWGNLPPRLRDGLLQGLEDRFSPLYRDLTELYYQRLAEDAQTP